MFGNRFKPYIATCFLLKIRALMVVDVTAHFHIRFTEHEKACSSYLKTELLSRLAIWFFHKFCFDMKTSAQYLNDNFIIINRLTSDVLFIAKFHMLSFCSAHENNIFWANDMILSILCSIMIFEQHSDYFRFCVWIRYVLSNIVKILQ